MDILLLIGSPGDVDISHAVYANGLRKLGHRVHVGTVNGIGWHDERITCPVARIRHTVQPYVPLLEDMVDGPVPEVDLVWLLNQPHPRLAVDAWQLLWRLNLSVPFVNDVTGLMMLNNKNNLPLVVPAQHRASSVGSNDCERLWTHLQSRPNRRWVLKRPNGGCGADVFVLEPGATNNRALVQSLTGNATASAAMTRGGLVGLQADYAVLQEYVHHRFEKRIVLAGGTVAAAQTKCIPDGDHRGNMTQQASMALATVTEDEERLAEAVGGALLRHGIRFAGIDVAYPTVFEVNLVNPGGLVEPTELGLPDPYLEPALRAILGSVPGVPAERLVEPVLSGGPGTAL